MSISLAVPPLGESITQIAVGAWLKREGDTVAADEPVVELESDKATVDLPAPVSGILRRILKPQGATVAIGEVLGEIEVAGKTAPAPATPEATHPLSAEKPTPIPELAPREPRAVRGGNGQDAAATRPRRLVATPAMRRLMAEAGVTPDAIEPTAPGGRIRAEDVARAKETAAPARASPGVVGEREHIVPMSPLRRTVARRLVQARAEAAILTTFNEIDMSGVGAMREKHRESFRQRYGIKLGLMSFFVKAAIEALKAFPAVNAEVRGTDIVYKDHYDIGVAVGGGKGLVVPVLRDAESLSFAEVEKRIDDFATRARENKLGLGELDGGTFTISNGGVYGSLLSTPILNPPQSGILGLHAIQKRAVVIDDAIVIRPMMYVALSYDHRVVDGREAVGFLGRLKEAVEDPGRILLEV